LPLVEVPLWKQPEMIALAKDVLKYMLIAGIGLYLLLGVIRPALRNFNATMKRVEENSMPPPAADVVDGQFVVPGSQHEYEQKLQAVKNMANQDPKIVASVVKEWVSKDE
jgi:flagellar M-ring protein FliF